MDSIRTENRRVANIHTAEFTPMKVGGKPNGEVLQLNDAKPTGSGFYVFRMMPGTTSIAHRHNGDEEFLMIEGDLTDHDGTEYGPGDLVWLKDGTEHFSTTRGGCLMVVHASVLEDLPDR